MNRLERIRAILLMEQVRFEFLRNIEVVSLVTMLYTIY